MDIGDVAFLLGIGYVLGQQEESDRRDAEDDSDNNDEDDE